MNHKNKIRNIIRFTLNELFSEQITVNSYPIASIDTWHGDCDYKVRGGKIIMMSPSDYLKIVRPLKVDDASRKNIDNLKQHILSGEKLDPLAIYKDGKEDGRHRAYASLELGIKKVPVIVFKQSVNENVYYHGTVLPKSNPNIDNFKTKIGYRGNPMVGILREVNSPWVFFTDNYNLATQFGSAKADGLYYDKSDFTHKTVVLKYDINESDLNILDLTSSSYEFKLEAIGIKLWDLYGVGMYSQDQMWDLLDDNEISDIIVKNGINAVKLIENGTGYDGKSLAIHISKVNKVIKKVSTN